MQQPLLHQTQQMQPKHQHLRQRLLPHPHLGLELTSHQLQLPHTSATAHLQVSTPASSYQGLQVLDLHFCHLPFEQVARMHTLQRECTFPGGRLPHPGAALACSIYERWNIAGSLMSRMP